MLPLTIRDHSPMDDYRKIQSQIKYTVQYAPCADTVNYNTKEKLTNSKFYKVSYGLMLKLLAIVTASALLCALLIGGVGSVIELRSEKKDRETNISLDSKTWILNDGHVVISDEQNWLLVPES